MIQLFNNKRLVQHLAGCAALVFLACPADADSLKRQDLPEVSGVTLIGVEDGKLKYRTASGDREVELDLIEGVGIDAVPALAAGQKALAEGKLRAAQRSLETVWAENGTDWVKHFAGFYLMQAYDQRDQPVKAAEVFASLVSDDADVFFLSKPPIASLAEADANQKERIKQQILAVAESLRGDRRRLVQTYLQRVAGEAGLLPEGVGQGGADGPQDKQAARANAKVVLPKALWVVVDRRGQPEGRWDSVEKLSQGDHKAALDAIKPLLNVEGNLAPKLFIYGKALLEQAEATGDDKLYRDAGLAFMRVVVHFNRAGQTHPLVVPAQLEVAYIHKKIGREDIYQTLLFGGEGSGGLNLLLEDESDEYPFYRTRYYEVIGKEMPAEDDLP